MLKKILVGSGLAFALFLMMIFLFGDMHNISLESPKLSEERAIAAQADRKFLEKNLTATISTSLAEKVIQENPEGPQPGEDGDLIIEIKDHERLVKEAMTAGEEQFAPEDLIQPIVEKSITVLADNSTVAAEAYLQGVLEILKNNFKTPVSRVTDGRRQMFEKLAEERTTALEQLYGLQATPDLAELHRDILTLVGTQRNIFSALANYETDPMKALLAAKFESVVELDLKDITKRMTDYILEKNLNS